MLSTQQQLYLQHRLNGIAPKAAALAAGYRNPKAMVFSLERNPKIKAALVEANERRLVQEEIDKSKVIQGFLSAVDAATSATELVQAWRELGKLIGAYEPQKVEVNVTLEDLTEKQLRSMSDQELARYAGMDELLHRRRAPVVIEDAEYEDQSTTDEVA